ncbi:MAG: NHL repeat-containing protein [Saccharofermentanales bacterium]
MKKIFTLILLISLAINIAVPVAADSYQNYVYDHNWSAQQEPQAVIPTTIMTGSSLGTINLKSPQDVFVAHDGKIYVADTGNNRILIISIDYKLIKIISAFVNTLGNNEKDTFNSPTGIYVSKSDELYIADSLNGRIVVLNKNGDLVKIFGKPNTPLIDKEFQYIPVKIAVDSAKRLSIVAKNEEKGIIQIEDDGNFSGYLGAIPTPPDFMNMFIKLFGTKEMKQSMVLNVATVYSNIVIDADDFIYGTVGSVDIKKSDIANLLVRKMNPVGTDILRRYGNVPIWGDGPYTDRTIYPYSIIAPLICDIAINSSGIYSILEQRTGRVFTYDNDGRLLYTFGGLVVTADPRKGRFGMPVAIDYINNKEIVVLDSMYNQLNFFQLTEYGKTFTDIVDDYNNHDYSSVDKYIKIALKYTSKSELLYNNIGQYYYKMQDYTTAMKYYKLAENRTKYADAFQYYRKKFMSRYFTLIIISIVVLLIVLLVSRKIIKRMILKKKQREQG